MLQLNLFSQIANLKFFPTENQKYTARQPKSEVYNLIISDLTQVINSELPDIQTGNGVGRASKAAAYALLGKVYLTMATDSDFQ